MGSNDARDCYCPAGSFVKNGLCRPCPTGQYSRERNAEKCVNAPVEIRIFVNLIVHLIMEFPASAEELRILEGLIIEQLTRALREMGIHCNVAWRGAYRGSVIADLDITILPDDVTTNTSAGSTQLKTSDDVTFAIRAAMDNPDSALRTGSATQYIDLDSTPLASTVAREQCADGTMAEVGQCAQPASFWTMYTIGGVAIGAAFFAIFVLTIVVRRSRRARAERHAVREQSRALEMTLAFGGVGQVERLPSVMLRNKSVVDALDEMVDARVEMGSISAGPSVFQPMMKAERQPAATSSVEALEAVPGAEDDCISEEQAWFQYHDDATGLNYYYNALTKETSWNAPACGFSPAPVEDPVAPAQAPEVAPHSAEAITEQQQSPPQQQVPDPNDQEHSSRLEDVADAYERAPSTYEPGASVVEPEDDVTPGNN